MNTRHRNQMSLPLVSTTVTLVRFLEKDIRPSGVKEKKKKHYGFDFSACAYIDETCDGLHAQISAYGQRHQPQDKGHDGRIVED